MSKLEQNSSPINLTECPQCLGIGEVFEGTVEACNFCDGKGEVNEDKSNYFIGHLGEEFSDT